MKASKKAKQTRKERQTQHNLDNYEWAELTEKEWADIDAFPLDPIQSIKGDIGILQMYLGMKVRHKDWQSVSAAANDLKAMEATLKVIEDK